jgi:hypothetical protein
LYRLRNVRFSTPGGIAFMRREQVHANTQQQGHYCDQNKLEPLPVVYWLQMPCNTF